MNLETAAHADSQRVAHIKATNKSLNSQFQRIKYGHNYRAHSSEFVVGGVPFSEVTSAKLVALTVLSTIGSKLLDAEVEEARYMSARGDGSSDNTSSKLGSLMATLSNLKVTKRLFAAKFGMKKLTTA